MNTDLRVLMCKHSVKQWRVAREIGIAEATLSRLMREDLPETRKLQIGAAIEKLAAESRTGCSDQG